MEGNSPTTSGGSMLLVEACKSNDIERVKELLRDGIDPCSVDNKDGTSALMHAAENGDEELVSVLLHAGASYQHQDFEKHTAGEYAMGNPNKAVFRLLLEWAVQCEMALGRESLEERERNPSREPVNNEYLTSKIYYKDGKILDENGEAVMMGWEAPLMAQHAQEICKNGGDVCNIGFGMGIIDMEIQAMSPKSHTIIEAHPDVYEHMIQTGWGEKENVRIVFGRWQDVIDDLGPFDGLFFDTYGEFYEDMQMLHKKLPHVLREKGIYSFFNGLAPDNIYFHMVYGEIARRELNELGFLVRYHPIPIDATHQSIWEGVQHRYWKFQTYFMPVCIRDDPAAAGPASQQEK